MTDSELHDVTGEAHQFLVDRGIVPSDAIPSWTPLTGGVSSELWRVDFGSTHVVVKGALDKLKVDSDWRAPLSRNEAEWQWLQFAHRVDPTAVPTPLARDPQRGLIAMSFLPPAQYPIWKAELMAGNVHVPDASAVGSLVGRLHAASSTDPDVPTRFANDDNFHVLRIEPYLLTAASRNPDLRAQIVDVADTTASTHRALVHGDVSPKNILIGPNGPVLLDAECAWYGDPAFDPAFVLNHLVLKAVVRPDRVDVLERASHALLDAYDSHVGWEDTSSLHSRIGRLVPVLMLARVDGKSPVEYLDLTEQAAVRGIARSLTAGPPRRIRDVLDDVFGRIDSLRTHAK
ncbi:phosphotransferase family protein [Rhodococcus opacus]|uniref:phosphotransferase family protein n=1 Tax=Rhodococcus opacus TaxID=37919 RepID=UPI00155B03F5|nr:phosphotransferase [Rhodococcus opacus]